LPGKGKVLVSIPSTAKEKKKKEEEDKHKDKAENKKSLERWGWRPDRKGLES
jgi:hypothetical protein